MDANKLIATSMAEANKLAAENKPFISLPVLDAKHLIELNKIVTETTAKHTEISAVYSDVDKAVRDSMNAANSLASDNMPFIVATANNVDHLLELFSVAIDASMHYDKGK